MDLAETYAGNWVLCAAGDLGSLGWRGETILCRNVVQLCYTLCPALEGSKGLFVLYFHLHK